MGDNALLAAARYREGGAVGTVEIELPRDRSCATQARRWLERQVPEAIPGQTLDDLKLVTTELVENALLHGRGRIRLRLDWRPDACRVEVSDDGEDAAIRIHRQGRDLGGWGLVVVDQLADRWGAFQGTTHVWAELRVTPSD